jgi:WhiB family redox-sensing transcriptional regulator
MASEKAECPRCGRERFVRPERQDAPCMDCRTLLVPVLQVSDLDWKDRGICSQTDPEAFFDDHGKSTVAAKMVCSDCPVVGECLDYAIRNHERFGVWGGLSAWERQQLVAA